MTDRIPVYEGDDPYVFISYAHEDRSMVWSELAWLHHASVLLWYDEGIHPGSDWSDALANAIERCQCVLFFVTPRSIASRTCMDEIAFAQERGKPVVAVHLEATELRGGLALRLGARQAILKHALDPQTYREKLLAGLAIDVVDRREPEANHESPDHIERLATGLAIMPLVNDTGDDGLDVVAEDIVDELAESFTMLAAFARVPSGQDLERFQSSQSARRDVAETLGVGSILSGSMRMRGDLVRVRVELVDHEGTNIWSHRLDAKREALEDGGGLLVATVLWGVADAIRERLFDLTASRADHELGLWGIFHKAWKLSWSYTNKDAREHSRKLYELAVARDPDPRILSFYAADLSGWLIQGFSEDPEADAARARAIAEQAVVDGHGMSLVIAGRTLGLLGDHKRAIGICERGYARVSNFVQAKRYIGQTYLYAGRAHDAIRVFQEAEALELPGQESCYEFLAQAYCLIDDLDSAIANAHLSFDTSSTGFLLGATVLINAHARAGRIDDAVEALVQLRKRLPRFKLEASIRALNLAFGTEEAIEATTAGLAELLANGHDDGIA